MKQFVLHAAGDPYQQKVKTHGQTAIKKKYSLLNIYQSAFRGKKKKKKKRREKKSLGADKKTELW